MSSPAVSSCSVCQNPHDLERRGVVELHPPLETSARSLAHTFCIECLSSWVEQRKTAHQSPNCPLCRENIFQLRFPPNDQIVSEGWETQVKAAVDTLKQRRMSVVMHAIQGLDLATVEKELDDRLISLQDRDKALLLLDQLPLGDLTAEKGEIVKKMIEIINLAVEPPPAPAAQQNLVGFAVPIDVINRIRWMQHHLINTILMTEEDDILSHGSLNVSTDEQWGQALVAATVSQNSERIFFLLFDRIGSRHFIDQALNIAQENGNHLIQVLLRGFTLPLTQHRGEALKYAALTGSLSHAQRILRNGSVSNEQREQARWLAEMMGHMDVHQLLAN